MLPLNLLRIKTFNGAALTLFVVGAALMNISLLTSFFLTQIMGLTELRAGIVLSSLAVGSIVSSAISGPLSNKYGSHWFGAGGITLIIGATYALSGLDSGSKVGEVLLRLGVAGIGVGFTMAPVMSSAVRNVPEEKVGISSGIINMTKTLGSVLGVAIIVTVLQQNTHDQMDAANIHSIEMIQKDEVLRPLAKASLIRSVNSVSENGKVSSSLTTYAADSDVQSKEIKLLSSRMGEELQEASVKAFSRTFKFASFLLFPGIVFALFSDQWRKKRLSNLSVNSPL